MIPSFASPRSFGSWWPRIRAMIRCEWGGCRVYRVSEEAVVTLLGIAVYISCHGQRRRVLIDERQLLLGRLPDELFNPFPVPRVPRALPPVRRRGRYLPAPLPTDVMQIRLAPAMGAA